MKVSSITLFLFLYLYSIRLITLFPAFWYVLTYFNTEIEYILKNHNLYLR